MNLHLNDHYSKSPLIYWCILTVGSRQYAEDTTLLASLTARVMEMAMGSMLTVSLEVEVAEQISLLLTYLFPSTPKCGENIFVMCGTLGDIGLFQVKFLLQLSLF